MPLESGRPLPPSSGGTLNSAHDKSTRGLETAPQSWDSCRWEGSVGERQPRQGAPEGREEAPPRQPKSQMQAEENKTKGREAFKFSSLKIRHNLLNFQRKGKFITSL